MRVHALSLCVVLFVLSLEAAGASALDLGRTDRKAPPTPVEMVEPASDEGIEPAGVYGVATGQVEEGQQGNLYILVNPLSNAETRNVWWVQQEVSRSGDKFRGQVQFGEHSQGAGEYFGIVAMQTDRVLQVGEELRGLPPKMSYTKLKIVKRK